MKKLIALLSAFCLAANAEPPRLEFTHFIPNFSAPHVTNVNLCVFTVYNATPGATNILFFSTNLTDWVQINQTVAPSATYSLSALTPLTATNGFFKLMEERP